MKTTLRDQRARRNNGIDLIRGLLVVLVILGHFSEITQRDNFLTWFGFGFRMPLFIGLTGFLFNLDHARSLSPAGLFRKYYARLILPWTLACFLHLTLVGAMSWAAPFYAIVRPPYHLWFVPVMIAFIFTARASRLDRTTMLAIAIPASIAAMYLFNVGHQFEQYDSWLPDRRYFVYPIYFTFGMWLAERSPAPGHRPFAILLALIGLLWWSKLYILPSPAGAVAAKLILCIPLIGLLPWSLALSLNLPLLARIGRDSLFFYLWHPLAFALWSACGVAGAPLLALSLLSLFLAWMGIARMPQLRGVLGVRSPQPAVERCTTTAPGALVPERPVPERAA